MNWRQALTAVVCGIWLCQTVWAQEVLPTCQGSDIARWHACRGILDESEFSYAGDFRHGKFDGRGILEFTGEKYQGDYYQGEFKFGLKHGFGIYFFANGEKYAGHYVNGMRHGFGTYTFINGQAPLAGIWANNQWTGQIAPAHEERVEQKKNSKSPVTESSQTGLVLRPKSALAQDVVALVIGVESYQGLHKALYAGNDANAFQALMQSNIGIPAQNLKVLRNDKASRSEILSALKFWLPSRIKAGKTHIYIMFSGHGLRSDDDAQKYWLPFDVNKELLSETAISEKWILSELQKLQAKSVTIFLDTCYSGLARKGEPLDADTRGILLKSTTSVLPAHFTIISASAANQTALSADDFKQGIFSYFLVKGLMGQARSSGNPTLTHGELIDYLSSMVDNKAMSLNRHQQPQLLGDRHKAVFPW